MAADQVVTEDEAVPPAGEQVHLPDPSYLPIVVALALTVVLAGVLMHMFIVAFGIIVFLYATVRWVRHAREEMAELPLEHH